MAWFLFYICLTALACFVVVWAIQFVKLKRLTQENHELNIERPKLHKEYQSLFAQARSEIADQKSMAKIEADQIIADANEIADQARASLRQAEAQADLYQSTVIAMRNILDGYGDEYLIPASTMLDELAEEYSHKEAGKELNEVRKRTRDLVKNGQAAECDYVEENRRTGAINFVIDAFNGKVDTILAKVKHDNAGKLAQAIEDAFILVNFNGQAFRNARITASYKQSRLEELRLASIIHQLKEQEREEQRQIREQIREEEKARREYERAIKEAEKEERMLKQAMERARREVAEASAEKRAELEAMLADMETKLHEAEEKNQRAISMAQLTKRGHVYIISNIGSFGENVYKIGLTRRLEPLDRVKELGDASVPFPFDVHAMIHSDNAPALERELHNHFLMRQINKVNHRKEFFRATIAEIREEIESMNVQTKWTMIAEAAEYRETRAIEKLVEEDPNAKEAWLSRQLELDPTEYAV